MSRFVKHNNTDNDDDDAAYKRLRRSLMLSLLCLTLASTIKFISDIYIVSSDVGNGDVCTDIADGVGGWSVYSDGLRYCSVLHAVVYDECWLR